MSKLSASKSNEAYKLAHTARCKLNLAAKEPDRNLRFLLGHAFTLDKLMLRVAEIETSSDSSDDEMDTDAADLPRCTRGEQPRRASVTFQDNSNRPSGELRQEVEPGNGAVNNRRRSPPPARFEHLDDTDSDSSNDEYLEDENEDEGGPGLQRFESAAAQPPRMIEDEGSDEEEEEDVPTSPPGFTVDELKTITEGEVNEELAELYEKVAGCPCHGVKGPAAEHVWEVPQKPGVQGPRMAVIQVAA